MSGLGWTHERDCHFAECDAPGVVDVGIQTRGLQLGAGGKACAAHVGVVSELLLEQIRERTTLELETLAVSP